jgi:hypothetical protein
MLDRRWSPVVQRSPGRCPQATMGVPITIEE